MNKEPEAKMLSRDGQMVGQILNMYSRPCPMEGCTWTRIHVKWPDGKSTYPCSKGCLEISPGLFQIV